MSNLNLPGGWTTTTLGTFMDFKNGVNADKDAYGKGIKFVNVMDIFRKNCLSSNDIIGSVEITEKQLNEYSVVRGDILFNRTSETPEEIAFSSVYLGEEKITFGGFVIRGRQTKQLLLPEFAKYCFKTDTIRKEMIRRSQGAVRANIGQKDLSKVPIVIPPETDQKMIVLILDEWGHMIEKTEALIDAKERQFGWLQNALLRENSDTWETKPLNSLSQIKKGKQLNRDTLDDSVGFPVWNGGITPSGYTDKSNTAANTITISEGGNSCGFVNLCKEDFWLGGHCYAVEKLDASLDSDFLFFCLKANERRIMRLRVGSGLPNIQKKDIEKLQIQFPPIDEQKRIAHTLNTAQQEITLLKKLADQYRTQKRGLMQKLLSGEWHIKNREVA